MTTPLLIGRIRAAVQLARQQGVTVGYDDGWTGRGRPGFSPAGLVEHCTSDPAVLSIDRMRQILRNGHGSLTGNALCNAWVRRDGVIEVLAAGLCWHAGQGQWRGHSGNRSFFGIEYHRAQRQQILDVQLDAGAVFTWALRRSFGWPPAMVCDHREYAPGRKRDRHGVNSDRWRQRITDAPAPTPAPEPTWLEDLMAAGERQLGDIASALERDAKARERQVAATRALAAVEAARHTGLVREHYGLDPDPHSDGIHGDHVAAGTRTLSEVGTRLRDAKDAG